MSASVSQVELCLLMTMCGVDGMFSEPMTCERMPQMILAPHRFIRHHQVMKR